MGGLMSAYPNESHGNEPILLATHGMKESDAAVRAAGQLSEATHRDVRVIAVLEPPPLVASEYGFVVPIEDLAEERRDALLARVRFQLADVAGKQVNWPIEVRSGDPATTIARVAESLNAAVIVMGLGQHQLMDRVFGSETTLHTLRAARTPIFAVPQPYSQFPRRAVCGVDFSGAGMAAAHAAMVNLPTLTSFTLVHVAPRWDLQPTAYAEWRAEYERGVAPALERVIRELDAPPNVTVTTAIREGKTTKELIAAADEVGADVIVVGSKGLGFLDRVLVGSTATGVIRSAHCAIFAFPIVAVDTHAASRTAMSAGVKAQTA
ncbi:MAG TPA: universal stress protein [Gemmatimonadaceae bacterium]|jgi:nucleotide-binding universal stress UspA family protein